MWVGSRRRGAARKAVRAVCRVSATVGGSGSSNGSGRDVCPVAGRGTAIGVGLVVGWMTGGSAVVSASTFSVWKKRLVNVGSVIGSGSSGRLSGVVW